jgi:hypothetical protein
VAAEQRLRSARYDQSKKMAINTLGTTIADDLATNRRARLRLRLLFHTHDGQ